MPYLVFGLIMGAAVAAIAHNKGRSPVGWFFVGFFFGVIGLIVVLVSSNLNQEKYLRARQDEENRRLREQLRQERVKHETLREYTMRRLDAHDEVLGVDTRSLQALPTENPPAYLPAGDAATPQAASPEPAPAPPPHSNAWYFEQNGETRGPIGPEVIQSMLADGQISGTTLLWADHLPDWRPAALIAEFHPEP
jgi:uncharacterized protein DUF4339